MKKFALFFSAAAVLCILTGLTAYHRSFPLDADLNGLEPAALQWFNRGRSVPCEADQLELYQPVTVGRLTYVSSGSGWTVGIPVSLERIHRAV